MTVDHPADWGIVAASAALRAGRISSVELTEACLQRIADRDIRFAAWIRVYEDDARAAALAADQQLSRGLGGPLTGIPIGLKDVIGVAGKPLTADSAVLEGNLAPQNSTAWAKLQEAGMVLLGHLHCGEFANGVWGSNPWGASFSPGGSSSGSGIALAARMVPATLGSDGRGSIRMPAAFNGVTGVKPTFGLISTAGCIPITFTFDTLGPMARSAADCALLMAALVGPDPDDRATLRQHAVNPFPARARTGSRPAAGTRVGIPKFSGEPMSDGVASVYQRFQRELVGLGVELVSFDWPENPLETGENGVGDWVHILGAEAQVIHEQFAGREHLYRDEFRALFGLMTSSGTAVDYVKAQAKRAEYIDTWAAIFTEHRLTAVVHPASQDELFSDVSQVMGTPPRMMFGGWNDTNFPVVSVPAGLSPTDGSPVGMQIVGTPFTDPALLQLAIDIQSATDFHLQSPNDLDVGSMYEPPERKESGDQPPFIPVTGPISPLIPMSVRLPSTA